MPAVPSLLVSVLGIGGIGKFRYRSNPNGNLTSDYISGMMQ